QRPGPLPRTSASKRRSGRHRRQVPGPGGAARLVLPGDLQRIGDSPQPRVSPQPQSAERRGVASPGPGGRGGGSRLARGPLPLVIEAVYLFRAGSLLDALRARAVKIGVATSVVASLWDEAEIFPREANPALPLSREQRDVLALFADGGTHAVEGRRHG